VHAAAEVVGGVGEGVGDGLGPEVKVERGQARPRLVAGQQFAEARRQHEPGDEPPVQPEHEARRRSVVDLSRPQPPRRKEDAEEGRLEEQQVPLVAKPSLGAVKE
jgi:hypothetical protein